MKDSHAFFHNRTVLLLLSINFFLVALVIITIILRLGDTSESYIVQYRENLGLDAYKAGGVNEIISFIVFSSMVYVFQLVVGARMYHIRKRVTYAILLLSTLLLTLTLLVSFSLLSLR